jgi:hypothetical protein
MHILSTIKSYYEKLYTTKYPDENLTSNYIFDTKKEVLDQHLKEKLVYNYLELRDPPF